MEFEDVCMRLSLILHDDWIWKLYEKNEDVHSKMAANLLPSMMQVSDEHRRTVKLINMIMVMGDEELSWDGHDKMMVKEFIGVYKDQWPLSRKILNKFLRSIMNRYVLDESGKIVFDGNVILPVVESRDNFSPTYVFLGYCDICKTSIEMGIWYYGPWGAGWHCDPCADEHHQEANLILYGTY